MPVVTEKKTVEKAVRTIKKGIAAGAEAKAKAPSRATGTRKDYQLRAEAGDQALAILTGQDGATPPAPKPKAAGSRSAAKAGVTPRPKAAKK